LYSNATRVHMDPGPGALIRLREARIDPTKTNALIITHCHPDHYNDAEVLIEAMTHGCKKKRGILAASESVLNGHEGLGPAISKYHASKPLDVRVLKPEMPLKIDNLQLIPTKTFHSDPTGVGMRIKSDDGIISMTGDTSLKEEVYKEHKDAFILVLSVTRPLQSRIPYHLSTEDAASLIEMVKPKLAVLTHFGVKFIASNPDVQANWVEKQSGVRTISAWDGMTICLKSSEYTVQKCISRDFADPRKFPTDLDDIIA